jgi:hypothetical protein
MATVSSYRHQSRMFFNSEQERSSCWLVLVPETISLLTDDEKPTKRHQHSAIQVGCSANCEVHVIFSCTFPECLCGPFIFFYIGGDRFDDSIKLISQLCKLTFCYRYSVVGTGWTTEGLEFESQYGQEFSLLHRVQTDSGTHSPSSPMDNGGSFPSLKRQGREADHSN